MKKLHDGHLDRYDWSKATRGRLAELIASQGSNLRALDEDVALAFPDSEAVNAALRAVLAMRGVLGPRRAPRRTSRKKSTRAT